MKRPRHHRRYSILLVILENIEEMFHRKTFIERVSYYNINYILVYKDSIIVNGSFYLKRLHVFYKKKFDRESNCPSLRMTKLSVQFPDEVKLC